VIYSVYVATSNIYDCYFDIVVNVLDCDRQVVYRDLYHVGSPDSSQVLPSFYQVKSSFGDPLLLTLLQK
jgi:hypothetical protein